MHIHVYKGHAGTRQTKIELIKRNNVYDFVLVLHIYMFKTSEKNKLNMYI